MGGRAGGGAGAGRGGARLAAAQAAYQATRPGYKAAQKAYSDMLRTIGFQYEPATAEQKKQLAKLEKAFRKEQKKNSAAKSKVEKILGRKLVWNIEQQNYV